MKAFIYNKDHQKLKQLGGETCLVYITFAVLCFWAYVDETTTLSKKEKRLLLKTSPILNSSFAEWEGTVQNLWLLFGVLDAKPTPF